MKKLSILAQEIGYMVRESGYQSVGDFIWSLFITFGFLIVMVLAVYSCGQETDRIRMNYDHCILERMGDADYCNVWARHQK